MKIKSQNIIKDLSTHLNKLEQSGWLQHPNAPLTKAVIAELRRRNSPTMLQQWNDKTLKSETVSASRLANSGLRKSRCDEISTNIERSLDLSGMQLQEGSQKSFYKGIQKNKNLSPRQETVINSLPLFTQSKTSE
jgi:hypothetical protein